MKAFGSDGAITMLPYNVDFVFKSCPSATGNHLKKKADSPDSFKFNGQRTLLLRNYFLIKTQTSWASVCAINLFPSSVTATDTISSMLLSMQPRY